MVEIQLSEMKEIEVALLCKFREICEKEGFRYSLVGGTLLGAVRHGGFIPWDDDIDVAMPRPDYDAFVNYCMSHPTEFGFVAHENDSKYRDLSGKIYDKRTIVEEQVGNRWGSEYGVYVDVFPIDALAETYDKALKVMKRLRFKRELLIAAQWKKFERSRSHAWYWEPFRFAFYLLSRIVDANQLIRNTEKTYIHNDFASTTMIALVNSPYRYKEILPRSIYDEYTSIEFEGETFSIISNYDMYMSSVYGDYMKLPPEEKRVSHHSFTPYWKE